MWQQAQKWEKDWWGSCQNTLGEELKQLVYAEKMGLKFTPDDKTPYNILMNGLSVLDIGGGAVSLLLKCKNVKGTVVDPCNYPEWAAQRYKEAGIDYRKVKGEDFCEGNYDEVWIYNVLEHVENPLKIIDNAKKMGKLIRIFEWLNTPYHIGHPQTLKEDELNKWLNGYGKTETIVRGRSKGLGYYGIFPVHQHG